MNPFNKDFLSGEIVKWRDKGIIDTQTAQKIASLYNINLNSTHDTTNFILKLVAYQFFSLAFFTLIGANWEEIPRFGRLLIVLFVLALVNLGGFFTLKKGKENSATALFLLGNFCYGAAIALIAQIYHLGEHMADGVLLWAVGSFALSFAVGRSILIAQSLAIALFWFVMEIEFGLVMHGFLIFVAISCYVLWRDSSRILTGLIFISVFVYLVFAILRATPVELLDSIFIRSIVFFALSYCMLCVSVALVVENFGKFHIAEYLKTTSITCGVAVLLVSMTFYDLDLLLFQADVESVAFYKTVFGYVAAAFIVICTLIFAKFRRYYSLLLCVGLFLLPILIENFSDYSKAIFSFISVLAGIVLIKQNYLNFGLIVIFCVAIVRYIDLIGDYIGASLLFMAFAVTVLVMSRKRRAKNEA
ncbi:MULTISPECIES: DUF2157 domain-containing protein [Campylobacter]|mgnify:FL=1|uniref:DUF2157 domain-containing protein n=1 Tax=Campylobacter TaxID=194 RepID=UPI0014706EF9|nr:MULTISPECIES: DUF2157 domain-containing protein [Campylobacter]MBN7288533.1 DUF2157 domain-containing protein [Campylobacter curvus]MDU6827258.1 DUF2157 domain-containing protein [Campylobacter sp.]